MLYYLSQGIVYGFAAAVQPGPLQAYVIFQTLQHGWRRTIQYAFVPLCSDLPIIAVVLFVLAKMPDSWLLSIRLAGGLLLLYLAWTAFQAARSIRGGAGKPSGSARVGMLKAVLINLLNPNPYLYWGLIAGPILLAGWRESPVHGSALIAGFYLTMIVIMAAGIIAVSKARQLHWRVQQTLIYLSALGLAFFGVYQLYLGARYG